MTVEVPCVAAGQSTVVSKTSSTVNLAVNAIETTNATAIFYMWGNGDGATTFTLPDFRGLSLWVERPKSLSMRTGVRFMHWKGNPHVSFARPRP